MDKQKAIQLIDLLEVGYEGICHLEGCILREEVYLSDITLFENLAELFNAISKMTVREATIPNRVNEINSNLLYYTESLKTNLEKNPELFIFDFRYHFKSLFRILEFEIAYIVEEYVNKENYPRIYPEVGIIDHSDILEKGKNAICKASVVLVAYNNLNVTRNCIESILANTDDIDYELILVDNGSTDGIKEYFDSIEGAKVIHLEYNLHAVKGFNIGLMAAEGQYCAAVCNDFIFTSKWLKNLITCIESDAEIGYVSPGATYISNMQQISIPFTSIHEFQNEAARYNISNPKKWEERIVLLPNVLCCPTALLDRIGYYDTRYFRGEFADDDISFRIRRAGYKLVYCADTVTHHYGSLTTSSEHLTNSMSEGKEIFRKRYGLDAWDDARMNSTYFNINYLNLLNPKMILGIDVKCGATMLQIKNKIWETLGIKPSIMTFTTDEKYYKDLNTISEKVYLLDDLYCFPKEFDKKVDMVYIEKPIDCYKEDLGMIFNNLSHILNENGQLILMVNNSISIEAIYAVLNAYSTFHNRKIYLQKSLCSQASLYGFIANAVTNFSSQHCNETSQVAEYLAKHLSKGQEEKKYIEAMLKTNFQMYQFSYNSKKRLG